VTNHELTNQSITKHPSTIEASDENRNASLAFVIPNDLIDAIID
jgi:hypothetical protein